MPSANPSSFQVRVYYEDTDAGGIVYYANYLRFAERARTEMLRQIGIEQSDLLLQEGIAFAVRSCQVEYLKPARLDDLLTIDTQLEDIGKASLIMRQTIRKNQDILTTLNIRLAVVGNNMKPARLPTATHHALTTIFHA